MKKFTQIQERAERRKGGATALKKLLPQVATKKELAAKGDDRYLAMMTKCINPVSYTHLTLPTKA